MKLRQPCPSCPWRVDQDSRGIPGFCMEKAEALARTSRRGEFGPELGDPQFACHQSRPGEEIVCAGWLAVEGHAHPGARLNVALGHVPEEALAPGEDWPDLEPDFQHVIEKLRASEGVGS